MTRQTSQRLRQTGNAGLALLVTAFIALAAVAASSAADDDVAVAQSLAEMLQAARTVISDSQDLINDPDLGDKKLTGETVRVAALALYTRATGLDPTTLDPQTRQGRLMRAMIDAIDKVVSDNQATINAKGTGFKGFIPAVFSRLVAEEFTQRANAEAAIKVTAPPELIRNRKARPDPWETKIIEDKLLDPARPRGQSYSANVEVNGRSAYRVMVPEYYTASCLVCHGKPKGEMDITGYPKEGRDLDDLGAAVSITLFH